MNLHLDDWLDAYLDGELPEPKRFQLEKHLEECTACHEKMEQRQTLSSLLHELPPAANLKAETRFVAEVGLQLPPREGGMQLPNLMWWLVPAMILLAMAFIQTVFVVSSVVGWVPGFKEALFSASDFAIRIPTLPSPLDGLLAFFTPVNGIGWGGALGWAAMLVMGILYLDWLAAWWMRKKNSHKESE